MKSKKQTLRQLVQALRNPRTFILLVVAIALTCIALFLFATRPTPIDKLGISYTELLDKQAVKENLESKYSDNFELQDYLIYGENLMLYADDYSGEADTTQGKSFVLRNVETLEELTFTYSGGVDSGISLGTLPQGLYEVYIYDNYVKKRVYFNEEVQSLNFSTMRRNEEVKNITLQASTDYLADFGLEMNENYLFISVVDNIPMVKTIDVLIDPGGNVYDEQTNSVDYGVGNDLINEASASYELAEQIKTLLEEKGLRVELTRGKDDSVSYYGKTGRAGIGYEKQAKIFLSLGMYVDEGITRPIMMISPYSGGLLANEIAYDLANLNIELQDISSEETLNDGVYYDSLNLDSEGNYTNFELYPQLRETGGKATFAGQAENATANQSFASSYGMNAIYFQFANLASTDSINYYLENKDTIAEGIVTGIVTYYEIKEVDDETATS